MAWRSPGLGARPVVLHEICMCDAVTLYRGGGDNFPARADGAFNQLRIAHCGNYVASGFFSSYT